MIYSPFDIYFAVAMELYGELLRCSVDMPMSDMPMPDMPMAEAQEPTASDLASAGEWSQHELDLMLRFVDKVIPNQTSDAQHLTFLCACKYL